MKKKMKIIVGTLILSLMLSLVGWSYSYDITTDLHKTIMQKQDDIDTKSAEIARLDTVIQLKDETIVKQEKNLKTNSINIIEQQQIISRKNTEIKALTNKINKQSKEISRAKSETSVNSKTIAFVATAYVSDCNGCTGITATGVDVRNTIYHKGYRVIAVDPKIIPLNSVVRVNTGDESFMAIASDTGGAIKGYKVDLLVGSTNEAWDFGKKTISITVLKKEK